MHENIFFVTMYLHIYLYFLHAIPWLNYYETFGLYGLDVVCLTVAEQFYLLKKIE